MTDAITIQNPRNRGGSTGHVLAKRSVTFTEIRSKGCNQWKDVFQKGSQKGYCLVCKPRKENKANGR
ncbi:hypothetical protein AAAC10_34820 [Pseudomonas aeruginosa]|uniref:hypothetical protein n=1 Tax=Pseudomonas aeruginosa TaxID=287 RepID=UPI0030F30F5A